MLEILVIIVVCLVIYTRTIWYQAVIDDVGAVKEFDKLWNKTRRHYIWLHFIGRGYKDLRLARAFTILFHTANCVLVYLAFGRDGVSFLAALLFAVHPINTQCSVWLSGKPYLHASFFILLGVVFYWAAPLCYALSLLFSITSIMFPGIFIKSSPWWMLLLLPPFALVAFRRTKQALVDKYNFSNPKIRRFEWRKLVLATKTFAYYFIICMFPIKIGMFHTFGYEYGITKQDSDKWDRVDSVFWLSFTLLVLYVVLMVMYWDTRIGLGMWWYGVFIIMWCNIVTIQQFIAERYCYLANAGLMLAVSSILKGGLING
jgi:hypothetical protein